MLAVPVKTTLGPRNNKIHNLNMCFRPRPLTREGPWATKREQLKRMAWLGKSLGIVHPPDQDRTAWFMTTVI